MFEIENWNIAWNYIKIVSEKQKCKKIQ